MGRGGVLRGGAAVCRSASEEAPAAAADSPACPREPAHVYRLSLKSVWPPRPWSKQTTPFGFASWSEERKACTEPTAVLGAAPTACAARSRATLACGAHLERAGAEEQEGRPRRAGRGAAAARSHKHLDQELRVGHQRHISGVGRGQLDRRRPLGRGEGGGGAEAQPPSPRPHHKQNQRQHQRRAGGGGAQRGRLEVGHWAEGATRRGEVYEWRVGAHHR